VCVGAEGPEGPGCRVLFHILPLEAGLTPDILIPPGEQKGGLLGVGLRETERGKEAGARGWGHKPWLHRDLAAQGLLRGSGTLSLCSLGFHERVQDQAGHGGVDWIPSHWEAKAEGSFEPRNWRSAWAM
jgi:hypothetical protein